MLGVLLGFSGIAGGAYLAAVAAGVCLLVSASKNCAGYASLTFIFVGFFLAYGLIAPAGALAGLRIFYAPPYATDMFVAHFCLACAGLILGLNIRRPLEPSAEGAMPAVKFDHKAILTIALACAATATVFEAVNIYRAGGPEIIFAGKLKYQNAITELTATLPAEYTARVAVILFALWYAYTSQSTKIPNSRGLVAFLLLIAPVLGVFLVLGRRTDILAFLLCGIVAFAYLSPIRRLTRRVIWTVPGLYFLFVILFVLRQTVFHPSGGQTSPDHFVAALLHALFPAGGEFGAPFWVFSAGIKLFAEDALVWGASYIDGIALVVPSFLYPGDKPVQLDTALYMAVQPGNLAQLGSTASFGYSPILEAWINFGVAGVFLVFFASGWCLQAIERTRMRTAGFAFVLFYLLILPIGQTFHRSTFGNAVLSPGLWILLAVLAVTMMYHLAARFIVPRFRSQE